MIASRAFYVFALATFIGCASSGPADRADSRILTRDEIVKSGMGGNAYDVISRLRPAFLVSRGQTTLTNGTGATSYPTIYVDGLLYGDITTLKSLDAAQIGEVRMYQAWEAQTKFGMGNNGGVIAISSRR
jgi:hypothetical protein